MPVESFLRTRKKLLLAKLESTYGTDPTPTGADNAILTQNLSIKPQIDYVERKTDRGNMGGDLSLHTSRFLTFEFDVDLQSSGAAGTAPAWGKLLKACGFAEATTAGISGNLGAASIKGATTITLGAGASTTADFHKNQYITIINENGRQQTRKITGYTTGKVATVAALTHPVTTSSTYSISEHTGLALAATGSTITLALPADGSSSVNDYYAGRTISIKAGTGRGQSKNITGYVGNNQVATIEGFWETPLDTTSEYTISSGGRVAYTPVSANMDALTLYGHMDGQLRKATGCRGTVSLKLSPKNNPLLHFTFTGLWADPVAAIDAEGITTAFKMPVPVSDVNTPTFTWMGLDLNVYEFDIDIANDVKYRDIVNATSVSIIDRKPAGNITIEAPELDTKNWWVETFNNEAQPLSIVHGLNAGNIIEIYAPRVQCFNPTDGDQDGVLTVNLKMSYLPLVANDEIQIIAR